MALASAAGCCDVTNSATLAGVPRWLQGFGLPLRRLCPWHRNSECTTRAQLGGELYTTAERVEHFSDQREAKARALRVLAVAGGLALEERLEDRNAQARFDAWAAVLHAQ